ncbi:extracellular solute-binding protein [Pokkaliibacter sp. CJK22405]|uniref:extracellular solute-binding protein n=1 Tax=Pokkaliibacter sp. CJK22405 TaxID=3384615 RepID=UPI0039853C7E
MALATKVTRLCAFSSGWIASSLGIIATSFFATSSVQAAPAVDVSSYAAWAMYGDPKYPPGFTHFDYTNPNAPVGGTLKQSSMGTFDSLNPYISKGTVAEGSGLLYDTLAVHSQDETSTIYGLIANRINVAPDRTWVEFGINPKARFQDGTPITAEDVKFSFETLTKQGAPLYALYYADVTKVSLPDSMTIRFEFKNGNNRELPMILAGLPVFPEHYWKKHDFTKADLTPPVGSGPYKIEKIVPGRSIQYVRDDNYWAWDLPVMQGRHNFEHMDYEYYRDGDVALEAFKAGEFDLRIERSASRWVTRYDIPAVKDGRILKLSIPDHTPSGMQGFIYNLRKPLFQNPEVREALAYAYDFEWANKNLSYGELTRTRSYFQNSPMASHGTPDPIELSLLDPLKSELPQRVFTEEYNPPATDGSGNIRPQLRQALRILKKGGWEIHGNVLRNVKNGEPMRFELLIYSDPGMERTVLPFVRNLRRIGIDISIRRVDITQYINRVRQFDYDMIVGVIPMSNSPGNELRDYFNSANANTPDSSNLAGIQNPAVDSLVESIINAPDKPHFVAACQALDRTLLWNFYLIPQFTIADHHVAIWNKFGRPTPPPYSIGVDTWWSKAAEKGEQ